MTDTTAYTTSPGEAVPAQPANRFAIASLVAGILAFLTPAITVFAMGGGEFLQPGALEGWGILALAMFIGYGVLFALPVALVALVLAIVSLKVKNRGRKLGTAALVVAGVQLLVIVLLVLGTLLVGLVNA